MTAQVMKTRRRWMAAKRPEPPDRAEVAHRVAGAPDAEVAAQDPGAGAVPEGDEGKLVDGDEPGQQQEPGADEGAEQGAEAGHRAGHQEEDPLKRPGARRPVRAGACGR